MRDSRTWLRRVFEGDGKYPALHSVACPVEVHGGAKTDDVAIWDFDTPFSMLADNEFSSSSASGICFVLACWISLSISISCFCVIKFDLFCFQLRVWPCPFRSIVDVKMGLQTLHLLDSNIPRSICKKKGYRVFRWNLFWYLNQSKCVWIFWKQKFHNVRKLRVWLSSTLQTYL